MLVKIADWLQNCQGDIRNKLEPEIVSSFCSSYVHTGANCVATFGIQHLPSTMVTEVTKRHLGNGVLSPLLTIRKK